MHRAVLCRGPHAAAHCLSVSLRKPSHYVKSPGIAAARRHWTKCVLPTILVPMRFTPASRYSLRARINDFKLEELKTGIDEAHARGKLFFVASNLLPHNSKDQDLYGPVIAMKPDALIMADLV
jgi:hypothetical protein